MPLSNVLVTNAREVTVDLRGQPFDNQTWLEIPYEWRILPLPCLIKGDDGLKQCENYVHATDVCLQY